MIVNIKQKTCKLPLLSTVHPPCLPISQITACADTGSHKILLRETDASLAKLAVRPATKPLVVQFADGNTALSTGTASIALPATNIDLPVHVFPDKALQQSLFGINDITNKGYDVTFSHDGLAIQYAGAPIYYSPKLPTDMGWTLPLLHPAEPSTLAPANAVISLPSDKSFVEFMHATFGSPAVSTFLRALRLQWLDTIPRLTAALVSAHRPNSLATALGHLDQKRQGLDSTTKTRSIVPNIPVNSLPNPVALSPSNDDCRDPMDPDDEDPYDPGRPPELYCKLVTAADIDASGRFPVASARKHEYMLLSYFKGYVHVEPLHNRHHTSYIDAYQRTLDHWKQYGSIPAIFRLDNETSTQLESFIATFATFTYFPPGNHRANRAERAIRTWKNHFIATLATMSPTFPMKQWDQLIPIAEITLNCLLPWHPDPTISAYHGLTGSKFDFRAHPLGPAGTAVLIHDKPDNRGTWQVHGTPGYYLGPSMAHYRTHRCLSKHTGRERYADTVAWFPENLTPPTKLTATELLHAAILDLRAHLKRHLKTDNTSDASKLIPSLVADIEDLSLIYNPALPDPALEQRVTSFSLPAIVTPVPLSVSNPSPPPLPDPIVLDLQRPNTPLSSSAPPTVPAPPYHHSYRTRSRTVADRSTTIPPVPAFIVHLSEENDALGSTSSHDSLHDYIHAWATFISTTNPIRSSTISHLSPANASSVESNVSIDLAQPAVPPTLNLDTTGAPLRYKTAKKGPNKDSWQTAEDTEISRLLDTPVMYARHPHEQPADRRQDTTYYNPQVKEKIVDNEKTYRIRGTIGGDRINYTGITKANTAALPVVKMLLQSVVSDDAQFMTIDIKDFYLNTALPRSEWMRIPVRFLSDTILDKHNLRPFIHNGAILFEVVRSLYGLPHAGKISQDELISHLAQHGYHQTSTPCLFRHTDNGITFTLVVDDFGVKFRHKASVQHLIDILQLRYQLTTKWNATKYLGITLRFDPVQRLVGLSLPGYVAKALTRFPCPVHNANSPSIYVPPNFGATTQAPTRDTSPPLSPTEKTEIQAICGAFLYYSIAVDPTGYPAVTALSCEQSHPTQQTRAAADRLLAYYRKFPNNELLLRACKMRLHQQADGSYLSRNGSRSVAGGISYLSNDDPTEVNGAIHVMSTVISTVMSSVGETEYVACFLTGQHGAGFRQVLEDLGYPQPPTYILTDNKCAEGIANNTIKPKRTKSIEMQYHWIRDRVARQQFIVEWRKGEHNLADFFTKALPVHVHQSFMPLLVRIPDANPGLPTPAMPAPSRTCTPNPLLEKKGCVNSS